MKVAYLPAIALGAALLTAGLAHATMISGTGTFTDDGPAHNGLNFTGVTDNGAITNVNLSLGTPYTVTDFLTISSADSSFFSTPETDKISESFNFTLPSAQTGSLNGSGTEDVDTGFWGIVDGVTGKISWNNPLNIDFADGSILSISLSNAAFNENGYFSNPNQSVDVNATFDLIQGSTSTSVPEPGTLALMAAALLGLWALRRRRSA